jgi:hypothetical protein
VTLPSGSDLDALRLQVAEREVGDAARRLGRVAVFGKLVRTQ